MTQKAIRLLFLAASACLLCLGCDKKPQPTAKAVYLVPIGSDLSLNIDGLQSYYQEHYGLGIKTLPSMAIDDSVLDRSRNQLVAEHVVDAVQSRYSEARDPENVLIGLTAKDMYIQQGGWPTHRARRKDLIWNALEGGGWPTLRASRKDLIWNALEGAPFNRVLCD